MSHEFPYLVVSASGKQVALFARPEMALLMCERLEDGSTIHANDQVLWTHDSAAWDAAHAGQDDGIKMLTATARLIEERELAWWRSPETLRAITRLAQDASTGNAAESHMNYVVREIRHGYLVVRGPTGNLADSSCVEAPGPAVQFDLEEAERVAEQFSVDRGGFCAIWRAFPVEDEKN